jgi:hypothetical protein
MKYPTKCNILAPLDKHSLSLAAFVVDVPRLRADAQTEIDCARWMDLGETLRLAASFVLVELRQACFERLDSAPGPCFSDAINGYRNRNDLAKAISIFNLIWEAAETTIGLIQPKKALCSNVDSACRFLRVWFNCEQPVEMYKDSLRSLHVHLAQYPEFLQFLMRVKGCESTEAALQLIARIRHRFPRYASIHFSSQRKCFQTFPNSELIELSSRLTLFSIQHLLLGFLKTDSWTKNVWRDEDGAVCDIEAERCLRSLHLCTEGRNAASHQLELTSLV